MDEINLDLQVQMFIVAGIALASIFISFVLLVLSCLLILKVKRLNKKLEKCSEGRMRDVVEPQFQSAQIHPHEELGRRGFVKLPAVPLRADSVR